MLPNTNLRLLAVAGAVALGLSGAALAGGTHAHSHGDEMAIGEPGEAADVSRTVAVTMRETGDGQMIFEPATIDVAEGETVRFEIVNVGVLDHEFVMDTHEAVMKHKAEMEKFPEMIHDDPNAVRLAPGETGQIVWAFTKAGTFTFACLIPGHYGAGMHGALTVVSKS